jgi:hypothetical protein
MSSAILTEPSENPRFDDKNFSSRQNNIRALAPPAIAVSTSSLTEADSIARSMALHTD